MASDAPPRVKRFEQKQAVLLDAAARLFNQKGLKGATLAELAQRVGLITSGVTYYYRRKEELATACLLKSIEFLEEIVAAASETAHPRERLDRVLRLYVRRLAQAARAEAADIVTFKDMRALTSPHVELVFSVYNDLFRNLRRLLAPPGGGRSEANACAHLVLSVMHDMRNWIGRYDPADYDRVGSRICDVLANGLAGPGVAWRPPRPDFAPHPLATEVSPEAFLRAATLLINDQGYRGASVEKISALLNVTKGSFYHHNENKDDLVAECFRRSFAVIRRVQDAAQQRAGSGWDRLSEAFGTLVRFQLSDAGPLLRSSAFSALPEVPRAEFEQELDRLSERFGNLIVDGMIDGSIRAVDPAIAARLVEATINSAAELRRWVRDATAATAPAVYARPLLLGLFRAAEGDDSA